MLEDRNWTSKARVPPESSPLEEIRKPKWETPAQRPEHHD